mgnify:CR=1 FL=1
MIHLKEDGKKKNDNKKEEKKDDKSKENSGNEEGGEEKKDTVTVRLRDTMEQIRMPISELVSYIDQSIQL